MKNIIITGSTGMVGNAALKKCLARKDVGKVTAIVRRSSGITHPKLTEVIVHDLYIAEIMKKHRDILEADFGKDLIELRHKFSVYPDNKKHYIE